MKKYTIHFHGRKLVTKQGEGNTLVEVPDEWENSIQSDFPPAIWQLTDFAYLRVGFPGSRFHSDPEYPGLFHASEWRDRHGCPNSRGKFFVRVEVRVTASLNNPTVVVGNLGGPFVENKGKSSPQRGESERAKVVIPQEGSLISRPEAIQLLKKLMSEKHPLVKKFKITSTSVGLTHYGFVHATWNQGKSGITLPSPCRLD